MLEGIVIELVWAIWLASSCAMIKDRHDILPEQGGCGIKGDIGKMEHRMWDLVMSRAIWLSP